MDKNIETPIEKSVREARERKFAYIGFFVPFFCLTFGFLNTIIFFIFSLFLSVKTLLILQLFSIIIAFVIAHKGASLISKSERVYKKENENNNHSTHSDTNNSSSYNSDSSSDWFFKYNKSIKK